MDLKVEQYMVNVGFNMQNYFYFLLISYNIFVILDTRTTKLCFIYSKDNSNYQCEANKIMRYFYNKFGEVYTCIFSHLIAGLITISSFYHFTGNQLIYGVILFSYISLIYFYVLTHNFCIYLSLKNERDSNHKSSIIDSYANFDMGTYLETKLHPIPRMFIKIFSGL